MMNHLKQRKGLEVREFRFSDSKLYYNQGKFGNTNEIDIPFENIDGEKVSYTTSKIWLLGIAFGFLLFGVLGAALKIHFLNMSQAWIIVLLGTLLSLWGYLNSRREFWKLKLKSEEFIYLYKNLPSAEETNLFLKNLLEARNAYLRENYLNIDENLDYEQQYYNLRWLRSVDAITPTEFDRKYEELKQTVTPEKRTIGFTR